MSALAGLGLVIGALLLWWALATTCTPAARARRRRVRYFRRKYPLAGHRDVQRLAGGRR